MRFERRLLMAAVVLMLCGYIANVLLRSLGVWGSTGVAVAVAVWWVVFGYKAVGVLAEGDRSKFYLFRAAQILPILVVVGFSIGKAYDKNWYDWFLLAENWAAILGIFIPVILISTVMVKLAIKDPAEKMNNRDQPLAENDEHSVGPGEEKKSAE
jgi:hypothetical protein